MSRYDYERRLFSYLENIRTYVVTRPMVLGGISGATGGSGGPPGGYIGQLPQYRVTFDSTEAEVWDLPASGLSLLTNLNRIRYRLGVLEASGIGGSSIVDTYEEGVSRGTAHELDFYGATVSVADNRATITISGGGSSLTQEEIEDYVGAMVTGNTETGISVTYDDGTGKLNFDASHNHDATYAPIAKGVTNGDSHDHSGGDGAAIVEAAITLSDNTTNDVSTSKHGFMPKLDNTSTHFLNGVGSWVTPSGSGSSSSFHGCRVYRATSAQTIEDMAFTAVVWNAEDYDTDGYHATDDEDLVIPAGLAGYYHITLQIDFNDMDYFDSDEDLVATITNGTGTSYARNTGKSRALGGAVEVSTTLYLAESAAIRGSAYQATGGDLDLSYTGKYNFMCLDYLGA